MTDTVWYYDRRGKPAFYRVGNDVYKDGKRIYWIDQGNWFGRSDGRTVRAFYEAEKWLVDKSGQRTFYRS